MQLEETSEKLTVTSDKLTRTTSDLKETKLDRDAHKFLVGELTQSEDTLYDTANHVSRLQGFKVLDFSFNIEIFLFFCLTVQRQPKHVLCLKQKNDYAPMLSFSCYFYSKIYKAKL